MRASRRIGILSAGTGLPGFSYDGNYQLVKDGGRNWRIKFLSSGTFVPKRSIVVDIFAVGGGGSSRVASGNGREAGGGGGYTETVKNQQLSKGTQYSVVVGDGGVSAGSVSGDGGDSSFGTLVMAEGGLGALSYANGGPGGSGGGGMVSGVGGSDGANGGAGTGRGGTGQGTTTREFGEATGDLYGGGGGGIASGAVDGADGGVGGGGQGGHPGEPNTGGGAGGRGGAGGTGIVIIRNAR